MKSVLFDLVASQPESFEKSPRGDKAKTNGGVADDLFVRGRTFYEAKDHNSAIASLTQAITA